MNMSKLLKIATLCIVLMAVSGSFGMATYYLYQKSKTPPVVIKTCSPKFRNIRQIVLVSGSVVPREEVKITPKIPGIIQHVSVQPGDEVKEEQVLAELRVVPDQALLNEGYNRLRKAKINLMEAERKLKRRKYLRDSNYSSMSTEDFEKAKFEHELSITDLKAAENNLQIIKEGGFGMENNKNQTLIRATISGMVLDVPVKVGDTVIESNTFNEGTTIAIIADMQSMIFEGVIDESDVGKIACGMKLRLKLGAIENKEIDAVLTYIAPKGKSENEGQVQFQIKADITPDPDIFIRAGYSANAQIVLEERKHVLSIDEKCLAFEGDVPYVQIQKDGQRFERRDVKLGLSDGIRVEIVDGLTEKDKIKL
jgi:HlyD family secretion protein